MEIVCTTAACLQFSSFHSILISFLSLIPFFPYLDTFLSLLLSFTLTLAFLYSHPFSIAFFLSCTTAACLQFSSIRSILISFFSLDSFLSIFSFLPTIFSFYKFFSFLSFLITDYRFKRNPDPTEIYMDLSSNISIPGLSIKNYKL